MNIKVIEDGVLKVCPNLEICRKLWANDAIFVSKHQVFYCCDCVCYQCYTLGYKDALANGTPLANITDSNPYKKVGEE